MKRFLLGILTAVITLAVILGAGFLLADQEKQDLPVPVETLPAVTEESAPPTTEPETEPVAAAPRPEDTVPKLVGV